MARLPGAQDLGPAPGVSATRPIASYDTSAIARAGSAFAEGGRALGAGVARIGEAIGEYGTAETRWEYAQAHADFQTRKMDLDEATRVDRNFGPDADGKTLPDRYQAKVDDLQSKSAALISSGPMRERFLIDTAPTVKQGFVAAQQHARSLENDASVAYVGEQGKAIMDRAVKATDDDTRRAAIDSYNLLIDGLVAKGAVTQVQAVAMKQAWAQQYATADILARADSDPQGVINELRARPGSPEAIDNRIAAVEGKGKNPRSSAEGVGNFIDSTWLDMIRRNRPDLAKGRSDADILALRADENLGREMIGRYRAENAESLKRNGLEATPGNLYLAHFLGPGGAAAVLQADPKMPVQDALAKAVGPKKAREMIDANPEVLHGQLAGSVREWAEGKMGGAGPGGIIELLRPDIREQLLQRAQVTLDKKTATDTSDFKTRYEDSLAEAGRNGTATHPLTQADFIKVFGARKGTDAFSDYQADLKLRSDVAQVARLTPTQQDELVRSYEPTAGEAGFADQAKRQAALQKAIDQARQARDAGFGNRVKDSLAEAVRTGAVTEPIAREDFVSALGRSAGEAAFQSYDAELKAQRDIRRVPTAPGDQAGLVSSYEPVPGSPDYAGQVRRQDEIVRAVSLARKERDADPAQYAIQRIPSVQDAWATLTSRLGDATSPLPEKQAAARDFVNKTMLEQQKAGVLPADVRVLPKGYVEALKARLENPQGSGGTASLVQQLRTEQTLWGNDWPTVYRQIAPEVGSLVRVIGSGVPDAPARILAELGAQKVGDILKDQSAEKSGQIRKDVLDAFTPFLKSMAGNEGGLAVFNDFRGQAEKLSAYYIVGGMSSADAARKTFKELIGDRYDFRDSWRMPKGLAQSADEIQRGTAQAMRDLEDIGIRLPRDNISGVDSRRAAAAAAAELDRAPGLAEKGNIDLFNRPRVKNADGSISTVRSMSVGMDGKEVLIPTVSDDGRILSDEEAIDAYRKTGKHLGKFDTPENATAFAERLHTQQEAVYAQTGLSDNYLAKAKADAIRRDGKWVTAPDESGLALVYNDEAVRGSNGQPLILSWSQLGAIAERAARLDKASWRSRAIDNPLAFN